MNAKAQLAAAKSEATAPVESANPCWLWIVVVAGYFLPCLVGIGVWFRLQLIPVPGIAPIPFDWIVDTLPLFLMFSFLWVVPFVAVALLGKRLPLAHSQYRGLIYGAFLGTAAAEIYYFSGFWVNVEAIFLGVVVLPVLTFRGTVLGGAIGLLVGWCFEPKQAG